VANFYSAAEHRSRGALWPSFALARITGTLIDWAKQMFGYTVQVIKRTDQHLFKVLPKRWIVERTFAWLNWSRRLSKDYELRHSSAESMIYIAFAHMLLRRST
jgi:transposase